VGHDFSEIWITDDRTLGIGTPSALVGRALGKMAVTRTMPLTMWFACRVRYQRQRGQMRRRKLDLNHFTGVAQGSYQALPF
jgi:hypothetical protein